MIPVEFGSVDISNFKSFTGDHSLELGRPPGLYFVEGKNFYAPRLGSNGSGKSTLWDAICWCLFGRTSRGLKNPDVMPWVGKGSPEVNLYLKVDGKAHAICRTASPNRLLLDGKDCGQEKIVALLRMDYEIAINTILLGQDQDLFFDKAPAQKLALFHDALNLDRWDERSKRSADEVAKRELELSKFEGEQIGLERAVTDMQGMLADEEKKEAAWRRDFDVSRKITEGDLVKKREAIEDLQRAVDREDLSYDGVSAEVKALQAMCDRDGNALRNAQVDLQRAKDRDAFMQKEIKRLEDQLAKLKKSKNCPTCGQAVKADALADHRKEIEDAIDLLETEWRESTTFTIKAYNTVVDNLQKALSDVQEHLKSFRARQQTHWDALLRMGPEINTFKAELKALEADSKKTDAETNPHTAIMRTLRKRIAASESDLEGCKADIQAVEKELVRYRWWIKGYKDIKLHIVDEILAELQLATDGMMEDFGLTGWRVHYEIERETKKGGVNRGLHVLISSPNSKGRVRWESWSGGESGRLNICGALALSQVLLSYAGISPNMEALDEPASYFSGEGVADLCEFLAERAKASRKRIFFIDHISRAGPYFAGSIRVERDKAGKSRIAEGAEAGGKRGGS